MPLLAPVIAWFASFFTTTLGTIAAFVTKKVALITAAVAATVAAVTALTATLNGLLSSVAQSAPGGWIAAGIGLLPGNLNISISAIITAHAASWLYIQKTRIIQYQLRF